MDNISVSACRRNEQRTSLATTGPIGENIHVQERGRGLDGHRGLCPACVRSTIDQGSDANRRQMRGLHYGNGYR